MFDQFYGLTGRPFQLTPDPQFYFESATHRKALSYLGYGLAQGEGFIVVTGEVGAGKSTLVAHLMRRVDPAQLTVGQIVTSNLDGAELIAAAAQSLGIEVDSHDKAGALHRIEGFLHDEARAGRRCLLVVDETQNLSVEALEELRMLSNFQLGAHPLLQTLLLGQPEFRQILAEHPQLEQLRQRVIAAHHLEAMSADEIEPYVVHRLQCVGWQGRPEIEPQVFADLYRATGGIPRRVNQLMSRLLLLGAVEQRDRLDAAMLTSVREEMQGEAGTPGGVGDTRPAASGAPAPGPVKHAFRAPPPADPAPPIGALLAERDAQIAELQQAVVELSHTAPAGPAPDPAWVDRLAVLEARVEEQDQAVRHMLTMLIEWFEGEAPRAAA
ncbi:MAG: XrtA/PEP-CTERM system-associated ATPase [Cypionkella sp.]